MLSSSQPNNIGGGVASPVNYEIIDPGEDQIAIIQINTGRFRGVQFKIGKVGFTESGLSFQTEIVRKPWRLWYLNLSKNDLFTQVSGDILVELIQRNAQEYNKFLVG